MQINSINNYSNSFRGLDTKLKVMAFQTNKDAKYHFFSVKDIMHYRRHPDGTTCITTQDLSHFYTNIPFDSFQASYNSAVNAPDTLKTISLD